MIRPPHHPSPVADRPGRLARMLLLVAALLLAWVCAVACRGAATPPSRSGDGGSQVAVAVTPPNAPGGAAPAVPQSVPAGDDRTLTLAEETAPPVSSAPICAAPPSRALPPVRARDLAPPPIGAAAGAVVDAASGEILWGRDEHLPLQPASVTKIITALIAIERGDLDEVIPVTLDQRLLSRGSSMGLVTGDWFTLRDLLYGLMLPSGNDAAAVIAHHFAGGEHEFAEQMNRRLCDLGLRDSSFINPSGLGRGEFNLATAYDLAQVARVAMENPVFREIAAARTHTAQGSRTLWMRNLNELVSFYPGADGVKIGWTPGAGNTIVASATRNGHRVIVALLRTPNRAAESAALLDWAFASFAWPR